METIYINAPELQELDKKQILATKKGDHWMSIIFLYDSNFKSAKILRDYVQALCDLMELENKWKSRLILITDELNNNAIEYGSLTGDINIMRIDIEKWLQWTYVSVEIEDTGKWKEAKKAKDMELLRTQRLETGFKNHISIRWRGLFMIIMNLVDELYFKDSERWGLIVGIKKKL